MTIPNSTKTIEAPTIWNFRGREIKCAHFPDHVASHLLAENEPEVKERHWHVKLGDVVLDVGAAFGEYTLPALACGAARVHAWAPEGYAKLLAYNLNLNGWADRVAVHTDGVWSESGFVTNYPSGPFMPTFSADAPADAIAHEWFKVRKLDDVDDLANLSRLDWLKLDVEGAEEHALLGASRLINTFRPKILIEIHRFKDGRLGDRVLNVMRSYGYERLSTVPYHGTDHDYYEHPAGTAVARVVEPMAAVAVVVEPVVVEPPAAPAAEPAVEPESTKPKPEPKTKSRSTKPKKGA